MAEKLSLAPDGAEFYIFDLPNYYAVGDRDVFILTRSTSLGDEPTPHDEAVAEYLDRVGTFGLLGRYLSEDPAGIQAPLKTWHYVSARWFDLSTDEQEARIAELLEPTKRASERADRRWAKALLE